MRKVATNICIAQNMKQCQCDRLENYLKNLLFFGFFKFCFYIFEERVAAPQKISAVEFVAVWPCTSVLFFN